MHDLLEEAWGAVAWAWSVLDPFNKKIVAEMVLPMFAVSDDLTRAESCEQMLRERAELNLQWLDRGANQDEADIRWLEQKSPQVGLSCKGSALWCCVVLGPSLIHTNTLQPRAFWVWTDKPLSLLSLKMYCHLKCIVWIPTDKTTPFENVLAITSVHSNLRRARSLFLVVVLRTHSPLPQQRSHIGHGSVGWGGVGGIQLQRT
jgi:hypothetical protein